MWELTSGPVSLSVLGQKCQKRHFPHHSCQHPASRGRYNCYCTATLPNKTPQSSLFGLTTSVHPAPGELFMLVSMTTWVTTTQNECHLANLFNEADNLDVWFYTFSSQLFFNFTRLCHHYLCLSLVWLCLCGVLLDLFANISSWLQSVSLCCTLFLQSERKESSGSLASCHFLWVIKPLSLVSALGLVSLQEDLWYTVCVLHTRPCFHNLSPELKPVTQTDRWQSQRAIISTLTTATGFTAVINGINVQQLQAINPCLRAQKKKRIQGFRNKDFFHA